MLLTLYVNNKAGGLIYHRVRFTYAHARQWYHMYSHFFPTLI